MPMTRDRRPKTPPPTFFLDFKVQAPLGVNDVHVTENETPFNPDEITEILPNLFLGPKPDELQIQMNGISAILNVAKEVHPIGKENVVDYLQLPLEDDSDQPIGQHFDECNNFIRRNLESGGRVLVHCRMGVSRSATIVIAYLMASGFISYRKAFDHVKERRLNVSPNLGFTLTLREYQKRLGGGSVEKEEFGL
jgi:hypothetical protein